MYASIRSYLIRVGSSDEADISDMIQIMCKEQNSILKDKIEFLHGFPLLTHAQVFNKAFPLPKENPIKPLSRSPGSM